MAIDVYIHIYVAFVLGLLSYGAHQAELSNDAQSAVQFLIYQVFVVVSFVFSFHFFPLSGQHFVFLWLFSSLFHLIGESVDHFFCATSGLSSPGKYNIK